MTAKFRLTEYQRHALSRIEQMLGSHGIVHEMLRVDECPPWLKLELSSPERGSLEIHIRDREVVMHAGPRLLEVYSGDFQYGEFSEIERFVTLLDRYLSGLDWDDHRGPVGWLRRLFSRDS